MIFDVLLSTLSVMITFTAYLLPDWAIPTAVLTPFSEMFAYAGRLETILPIEEMVTVLALIITFEVSLLAFRVVSGIISFMRGGGKIDI